MSRARTTNLDQNESARSLLDQMIASEEAAAESDGDEIAVSEALRERPIMQYDTGREKTRVLFVTNDTSYLNPTDDALESFYALAEAFDEIHVMVLRAGVIPTKPVLRVRENIWLYIASAENWWWTPVIAHEVVAANELVFAGGFRPDLVVGLEPFESGLAAQLIGRTYDRPVQIHVRKNFHTKTFKQSSSRNWWRRFFAWYVLRRAPSVRVQSQVIARAIEGWCRQADTLRLIPQFTNAAEVADTEPQFDVHEQYPMYEKILLYVGPLTYTSSFFGLLDTVKYVLANPRVGLVVLGDGPIKKECEEKIKKIGLTTQVAFPKPIVDVATYLKTADALIVSDLTTDADIIALRGAVAGIPLVLRRTDRRVDYFTNGQDALLCGDDEACLKTALQAITHDEEVRTSLQKNVRTNVADRILQEEHTYTERYRNSLERVFLESNDVTDTTEPVVTSETS